MASPAVSPTSTSSQSVVGQPKFQDQLSLFCAERRQRQPAYQVITDRRGGRTAWSCTVNVCGQHVAARYWYDGQYVTNAKEDAAEVALQTFGVIAKPVGPNPMHLQNQQRSYMGVING